MRSIIILASLIACVVSCKSEEAPAAVSTAEQVAGPQYTPTIPAPIAHETP